MTLDLARLILDGGGTLALCLVIWWSLRDQTVLLREIKSGIDYLCGERAADERRRGDREPTRRTTRAPDE